MYLVSMKILDDSQLEECPCKTMSLISPLDCASPRCRVVALRAYRAFPVFISRPLERSELKRTADWLWTYLESSLRLAPMTTSEGAFSQVHLFNPPLRRGQRSRCEVPHGPVVTPWHTPRGRDARLFQAAVLRTFPCTRSRGRG